MILVVYIQDQISSSLVSATLSSSSIIFQLECVCMYVHARVIRILCVCNLQVQRLRGKLLHRRYKKKKAQ